MTTRTIARIFPIKCCAALLLGVALSAGAPRLAHAQTDQQVDARMDALFGAHEPYRTFFDQLKRAVAAGDKNAVAAMVRYPVRVNRAGKHTTLHSKREFLARYAGIFTPKLVDTVARQQYATLFVRDQGAMIGDGEIWFGGVCRDQACTRSDVGITAFNLE